MIISFGLIAFAVAMFPSDPEPAVWAAVLAVLHGYTLVRQLWW